MLQLSFLGTIQITLQVTLPFKTSKGRALLAYLAVEAARLHERSSLVGLLWPEMPEANARNSLSKALGLLRQALADGERPSPYLLVSHQHLRFNPDSDYWLDVAEFQEKTAPQATVQQLEEAVALYRGEFLSGFSLPDAFAFEEWLLLWRERLHQQMLAALTRLTTHFLGSGELELAERYARHQLELDPWREAAHAQLMQALVLTGDRTGALAQFQVCRSLLAEELGVLPTAETLTLYEAIKTGAFTAAKPPAPPHNLPGWQTPFVGRQQELAAMDALVRQSDSRLVTVVGPGGQGKTRLALAYARRALLDTPSMFPDGFYFVSLTGIDPTSSLAEQFVQAIATALPFSPGPNGKKEVRPSLQQLFDYLSQKKMLLLLDDLDPCLPAADLTQLIAELLKAAPQMQIIATAPERLRLYGERVLPLSGLSLPDIGTPLPGELVQSDAIKLFLQAARRVRPNFQPQPDEWEPLGQLCHFFGGLPLAIELAASWIEMLSVLDILTDLQHDLDLLRTDLQDVPPRHRSVHRVLDHTWQRLTTGEQQALAQLSVFRGGFTREAAQFVALPEAEAPAVLHLLRRLLQKSLLAYDRAQDRYTLHNLLYQFAAIQLARDGEREMAVYNRYATYYCTLLQACETAQRDDRQQAALLQLAADINNIRRAWRQAVSQGNLPQIAAALEGLFLFLDARSWFREGEQLFQEAANSLTAVSPTPQQTVTQARLQARAGWFAFHLGQPEAGIVRLQESLAQLQQQGAKPETIFNLNYLGAIYRHLGAYESANHVLREALQLARSHDNNYHASISLNILGQTASLQGDYAAARRQLEEALHLKRESGDLRGMTYSLTYLGRVALVQADYATAQRLFGESREISQALGDQRGVAFASRNLGNVALAQVRYQEAEEWYAEALTISRRVGNRLEAALCLIRWGEATIARGDLVAARRYLREGIQEALAVESEPGVLEGLFALALFGLKTGQRAAALDCLAAITHAPQANPELQIRARSLVQTQEQTVVSGPPQDELAAFANAALRMLT